MNYLEHKAVTNLASGVVVEQSKLGSLNPDEMSSLMAAVYGTGKQVKFVQNAYLFFKPNNLIELLKQGNRDWELIADKFGLIISGQDIEALRAAERIIEEITRRAAGIKPTYPFIPVPGGWSVKDKLIIKGTRVSRLSGASYYIGLKTLEFLWLKAAPLWAENTGDTDVLGEASVSAHGYYRQCKIYHNLIQVGCQDIQRYEIEQFALSQGWDFPG